MRFNALSLVLALVACDAGAPPADVTTDSTAASTDTVSDRAAERRDDVDPIVAAWLERVDPAVFTRWGACPFECCVYRDWIAQAPVVVRAEPDSSARVVTTIANGARFEADTGFVRVTSPQLVVVTAQVEAYRVGPQPDGGSPDSLAPGDTVLVLDYQGEGHYLLTDGTETYSASQFWTGDDGWEPYDGPKGRTIGRHAAEWWAQVRTAAGVTGWIDAYASELGNVDACGMPE